MNAIELTQALINANDVTIIKADEQLEPEAKILAEKALSEIGENSGKFTHQGHHYTLDCVPVFDLIGDTKKYNTPEAATYRCKAREQQEHRDQSAVLTKQMKAIMEAYPINHPNLAPDGCKRTLKCLD